MTHSSSKCNPYLQMLLPVVVYYLVAPQEPRTAAAHPLNFNHDSHVTVAPTKTL